MREAPESKWAYYPASLHGHGQPEPIGLEYVDAALEKEGFVCEWKSHQELAVVSTEGGSTISLLSAITSEAGMAFNIAQSAKKRGEITVLGGYHASGYPRDVAGEGVFDYIIAGEGEEVIIALAKALLNKSTTDLERFHPERCGNSIILHAPRIMNLDSLPFPVRSEDRLGHYLLYDLMWPPMSCQKNTAIVLTSRGCVNNCDFCASASVLGCGVTYRSHDNILRELRGLKDRFETNTIVIIDQSFGQNQEWTMELCRRIKDAQLGLSWYHQSNLTLDRGLIRAMADAGCTKIGFGLEGLSPRAVEMVKPPNPTDFSVINDLFDYCASLGLFVKIYTIVGFPWETEEIIQEYFDWVPKIRAAQIKISYMTPFPGTAYWDRYRHDLLTYNWADFDTVQMPVVRNSHINVQRYHDIRHNLFRVFYSSNAYTEVTRQMIATFPRTTESYREFADYLQHFDMISGNEPWLEWVRQDDESRLAARGRQ